MDNKLCPHCGQFNPTTVDICLDCAVRFARSFHLTPLPQTPTPHTPVTDFRPPTQYSQIHIIPGEDSDTIDGDLCHESEHYNQYESETYLFETGSTIIVRMNPNDQAREIDVALPLHDQCQNDPADDDSPSSSPSDLEPEEYQESHHNSLEQSSERVLDHFNDFNSQYESSDGSVLSEPHSVGSFASIASSVRSHEMYWGQHWCLHHHDLAFHITTRCSRQRIEPIKLEIDDLDFDIGAPSQQMKDSNDVRVPMYALNGLVQDTRKYPPHALERDDCLVMIDECLQHILCRKNRSRWEFVMRLANARTKKMISRLGRWAIESRNAILTPHIADAVARGIFNDREPEVFDRFVVLLRESNEMFPVTDNDVIEVHWDKLSKLTRQHEDSKRRIMERIDKYCARDSGDESSFFSYMTRTVHNMICQIHESADENRRYEIEFCDITQICRGIQESAFRNLANTLRSHELQETAYGVMIYHPSFTFEHLTWLVKLLRFMIAEGILPS